MKPIKEKETYRQALNIDEIPESIHNEIIKTCMLLPQKQAAKKTSHKTLRFTAVTAGTIAAAFIFLVGVNAANPVFAESLPLIGDMFKQFNTQNKVVLGSNIGSYGKLCDADVSTTAADGGQLEIGDVYSDGQYVYAALTLTPPDSDADNCIYAYGKISATINGQAALGCTTTDPSALGVSFERNDNGSFVGTLIMKSQTVCADNEKMTVEFQIDSFAGMIDESYDEIDLDWASVSGSFDTVADTANNQKLTDLINSGEIKVNGIEATPSYVKIDYEIPFWGSTNEGVIDFASLQTESGEYLSLSSSDSFVDANNITDDISTITSSKQFDGVPNGTKKLILRFYNTQSWAASADEISPWVEPHCLAEVTIDLSTKNVTPSETYLNDNLAGPIGYKDCIPATTWSVIFDDIWKTDGRQTDKYQNCEDLYADEKLFSGGFMLYDLVCTNDGEVNASIFNNTGSDRSVIFSITNSNGEEICSYETLASDVSKTTLSNYDLKEVSEYKLKTTLNSDSSIRIMDNITVRIKDKDSDEVLMEKNLRMSRGDSLSGF